MLYEKARELTQLSYQNWVSHEVFSFGWFLIVGVLIVVYSIWLKLLDKSITTQLLLIGSLAAVANTFNNMVLSGYFGLIEYSIRLLPLQPPLFTSSNTLSPIIIMLVQQYTSSWKGYLLWSSIGFAFLNFVIFPTYIFFGIIQYHNWNVFFNFLALLGISLGVRFIFQWITGTQKRHSLKQT